MHNRRNKTVTTLSQVHWVRLLEVIVGGPVMLNIFLLYKHGTLQVADLKREVCF